MMTTTTTTSTSSSLTSPIIIPISTAVHVLGKNYDESIVLTSKYNQSLLRDRRRRQTNIIDNQTGIHQINCSLDYRISDRMNITRTDQVYVYPRRTYRRHYKYNPYIPTLPHEQKIPKNESNENMELINSIDQQQQQKILSTNENEIKIEPIINLHDEQVVISNNEYLLTNKINKRRLGMNFNCPNCQQKFKTKNQLNTHLIKCQYETEQNELINRRHYSKSESLLVSLLKQEAIIEKKQDVPMDKISSSNNKIDYDDDDIIINTDNIQVKLDKKDPDFNMKKQKNSKKTTINKNQSMSSLPSQTKSLPLIFCTMCGEANMINDELIRCSTCKKSMHAYKCLNFENNNIIKTIKTYSWQCIDCKKCIQCGTVEHDDELLFCDYCDRLKMIERCLYIFPLSVFILVPLAYFLSFFLAVEFGHSKFEFPFISRSSTDSPESCIYSQIINFASFLLVITIYIRYRQIAELIRNNPTCGIKFSQSNLAFLICGTTSAFCMSIISNFPHANVFIVRLCATYLTFTASVGALYCEMLLSTWIQPLLYSSRILPIIRKILTIICTLALIIFIVFQTITVAKYDNEKKTWTPTSPGWTYHLGTIISAWILTTSLLIYIFTLIIDFRHIKIISPKIFLTDDIIDDQD